jgi:hypothetical protein
MTTNGSLVLDHPVVRVVYPEMFSVTFTPDCMAHSCRCEDEGGRVRLDACCQHGADVNLHERDAILARAAEIEKVLDEPFRDRKRWFDDSSPEEDPDVPSGVLIRTGTAGADESSGCVFLQHGGRGCALHRAALENGFAPQAIKPQVCRLYPLAYGWGELGLSDDFARYSCANESGGPSVYRLMRGVLGDVFGVDLVIRLDRVERQVLGRRLPIAASAP